MEGVEAEMQHHETTILNERLSAISKHGPINANLDEVEVLLLCSQHRHTLQQ